MITSNTFNKKNKQSGFTLIELMIVVAIIGILIIIAFPLYQNFAVRAKVSELILATADTKISISEHAQTIGNLTGSGTGLSISTDSDFVSSFSITDNGTIEVTGTADALGASNDVTITLTPNLEGSGQVTWDCTGESDKEAYLPATCRN